MPANTFKATVVATVPCNEGEVAISGGEANIFNGTDTKNGITIAESTVNAARNGWQVRAVQTSKNESNAARAGSIRAFVICSPTPNTVETEVTVTVTATQTT
jgi:hypothetical protein